MIKKDIVEGIMHHPLLHGDPSSTTAIAASPYFAQKSRYDWRFRDGKWRRRCRTVARKCGAGTTRPSLTASNAILHLLNPTWVILVLDIKDAHLQVSQEGKKF